MHNYNLGDKVYHPCDAAPFVIVGIRENEIEIRGDWSGGTHPSNADSWVSLTEIKPFNYNKMRVF